MCPGAETLFPLAFFPPQKVSLGICHRESKREQLATGKCHPSLVARCHLEFLRDARRAEADADNDAARAPGAGRQIGPREERETLGRGKNKTKRQLDVWRLLLPL